MLLLAATTGFFELLVLSTALTWSSSSGEDRFGEPGGARSSSFSSPLPRFEAVMS